MAANNHLPQKEELYRVESYNPDTFERGKKEYRRKAPAIRLFKKFVQRGIPTMIHVLKDRNTLFASWSVLKDESGKDYHFGSWKPYFDHLKKAVA